VNKRRRTGEVLTSSNRAGLTHTCRGRRCGDGGNKKQLQYREHCDTPDLRGFKGNPPFSARLAKTESRYRTRVLCPRYRSVDAHGKRDIRLVETKGMSGLPAHQKREVAKPRARRSSEKDQATRGTKMTQSLVETNWSDVVVGKKKWSARIAEEPIEGKHLATHRTTKGRAKGGVSRDGPSVASRISLP